MTAFCDAAVTTPTGLSGPAATPMKVGAGEPVVSFAIVADACGDVFPAALVTVAVTVRRSRRPASTHPGSTVIDVSPAAPCPSR